MFQQREELNSIVKNLQGEKRALVFEIDCLNGEKERLETAIGTDKTLLQKNLAQRLMILKLQRPDLFTISGEKQIARLLAALLKNILA